jgi:transposase
MALGLGDGYLAGEQTDLSGAGAWMFRRKATDPQSTLWIPASELPVSAANAFYQRLDAELTKLKFGKQVREVCAPYYKDMPGAGGRPGIDPEVYMKMLMIGFFEGLPSERAIATRCADSLAIREFLHFGITESTPHHSSLSVIRKRLGAEVFEQVFGLVLKALKEAKLLRGKQLGMDASVMEANAALRSLVNRLTGEEYAAYVRALAEAEGIDPTDEAAVRRFDKNRPGRRTSNDEWQNPHDPDAKVGRTKRGSTRMIYKPEHVVDLETGAILDADVRPGDEHDTENLTGRILEAEQRINRALEEPENTERAQSVTADKGYFKADEVADLQEIGIETNIADPIENRRFDKLAPSVRAAVEAAVATVTGCSGRVLQRLRAELVERTFHHVLDCGGARRTTLRGRENIRKRYLIQAACANLSLLMRHLGQAGTPKQALAA